MADKCNTQICEDCKQQIPLGVYQSQAGWYIGRFCNCGPYSRESEYFKTWEQAQAELDYWNKLEQE